MNDPHKTFEEFRIGLHRCHGGKVDVYLQPLNGNLPRSARKPTRVREMKQAAFWAENDHVSRIV